MTSCRRFENSKTNIRQKGVGKSGTSDNEDGDRRLRLGQRNGTAVKQKYGFILERETITDFDKNKSGNRERDDKGHKKN